jgi:hypothetical protein
LLGFRPVSVVDQAEIREWLIQEILPDEYRQMYLEKMAYERLRKLHIEPPSKGRMKRLVASAIHRYEQALFARTVAALSPDMESGLVELINTQGELDKQLAPESEDLAEYPIHELKIGAGSAKVKNIKRVCACLKQLQSINLPEDLFAQIPLRFLRQYQQQVAVESPSHLQVRSQSEAGRMQTLAMLAAFCWVRQREITDDLVDLLLRILTDI